MRSKQIVSATQGGMAYRNSNVLRGQSLVQASRPSLGCEEGTMVTQRTFWLKACPRCSGDLALRGDEDGPTRVCLQCGYVQYVGRRPAVRIVTAKDAPAAA